MIFRISSVLTVALAIGTACVAGAKNGTEEGFVPLFNGKNLDGWVVMGKPGGFVVKDGVIHSDGASGSEWLRSEKSFKNYVLKLEWKVSEGGNSGVFIRADKEGRPWITGYEIQISNPKQDVEHCTGSLYGYVGVIERPDESAGKWHTFEIRCEKAHITILADGVKCIDYDQSSAEKTRDKPLAGHIGLQDSHSAAGHDIEYRNIRIKELD